MKIFSTLMALLFAAGIACTGTIVAATGPESLSVDLQAYDTVFYVSPGANLDASGDGSKERPYVSLREALSSLEGSQGKSAIFVAAGSYAQQGPLQMLPNVDLYGGFNDINWSRDIWVNRTILDAGGKNRVIIAADQARLDGFEIRGGVVRGSGGGLLIENASPVISNNFFIGNLTLGPEGWDPEHWHETANDGGALYCGTPGAPVISRNLFVENKTENGRGAGIAFDHGCGGEITENVIMRNVAGADDPMRSSDGGGISVFNGSSPLIANNLVLNNTALAKNDAGGIFVALWAAPEVRENQIIGNVAGDDAGGLFVGGQEHRYDSPLDPMPSEKDYLVKVLNNDFFGNSNSSRNSGATRITMESRALVEGNVAALNEGFYIQRTEGTVLNNTILEDFIFIETKDSLRPSTFDGNIVWGSVDYDTEATVTNSLFRDGFPGEGNIQGEPTFIDDVISANVISANYSKAEFQTRVLLSETLVPEDVQGRVVVADGKWAVIKSATVNSVTLWGDMSSASNLTIISRYRQTADSAGAEIGADVARQKATSWQPKRVNKAIELLESGQPVYYQSAYGGYDEGMAAAATWADIIMYNMEHKPLDFSMLKAFMEGLVDGGPTPSGHRTPAVVVVLPILGLDAESVRSGGWLIQQALAQGVHGVHLAKARSPEAANAFVRAARYPIHKQGQKTIGVGIRGWGSHHFAAKVWGVGIERYLEIADPWPLNPEGELLLGLKIEDQEALVNVESTLSTPGIAFTEHGPRDMGLSYGHLEGRADPPVPNEVNQAGDRVLSVAEKNDIFFLDNVLPSTVLPQLNRGVMIGAGSREDAAEVGREHTKREMPW